MNFSAMDYTLNIVNKRLFSFYLNICGLRKRPGKFSWGSRKVLDFFVSKRVGTLRKGFLSVIFSRDGNRDSTK